MARRTSFRPFLELLENRCCPSGSAGLHNGNLVITDDQSAALAITEVQAGTFRVTDHGNLIGSYSPTGAVTVQLCGANNTVVIDLDGHTTPGDINVHLGDGTNQLAVGDGTVQGNLRVYGGQGSDSVGLGGPTVRGPLAVNQDAWVQLNGSTNDALQVNSGVTVKGDLTALSANEVMLAAGSTVERSVNITGGPAGNTVDVEGIVDHFLRFSGSALESDHVTIGSRAVLGSLTVELGDGNSDFRMNGEVLDRLFLQCGNGSDQIIVDGVVGQIAEFHLGGGNDTVDLGGTIGSGADVTALTIQVQPNTHGSDSATFEDSLNIKGSAQVSLGAGNDKFTLNQGARFQSAVINGGAGTDTFVGDASRVTARGFEIFLPD